MYEAHFGLLEKPFALTPDPAFLYRSRHHNFGLMSLEYGLINRAGFCLLTGEVGSGKTLLVRQLLAGLGPEFRVGLISNTNRNIGGLLQWICLAFELDYSNKTLAQLYEIFVNFLTSEYAAGRRVLLIVDEAQNLGSPVLEELRVLSNVNADKNMVLQTFLVGQPELRATLCTPAMRQFAQRISSDYHLPALRQSDAREYVRHRLSVAGGLPTLISPDAIDLAWESSGGIPRLINQLCDLALVYAFGDGQQAVDLATMEAVVADRRAGGLWQPGASGSSLGVAIEARATAKS
jgi:type II secretory pathway predicted ATPase ExeA